MATVAQAPIAPPHHEVARDPFAPTAMAPAVNPVQPGYPNNSAPAPAYAPPPAQSFQPPPQQHQQPYAPQHATQGYAPSQPPYQPPAPQPYQQPVPQQHQQPAPQQAHQPSSQPREPARPSNPVPAPTADKGAQIVNADLGAHSQTNFYKGLAGNDIIDHGGLFVATYMVPKIGQNVRLKVSLPGGYEFEANGVVRWAREASSAGDAPPGFGAQFTQISSEARQLVYRYVRNREPLFYDDL